MTLQIKTNKLVEQINKTLDKGEIYRKDTCDHWNWDRDEHYAMNEIAKVYQQRGYTVTRAVNHGVTDWTITPKLVIQ